MPDNSDATAKAGANERGGRFLSAQRVTVSRREGYYVYRLGDDDTYWNLFLRFKRGELKGTLLTNSLKERDVHLVEDGGRRYVIKVDRGGWGFGRESRPERVFLKFFWGPFYSRLMRRVALARSHGCDAMQTIRFVAEKRTLQYCHEAVIILDYVEGRPLNELGDPAPYAARVREAMLSLHANHLALCGVSLYNFVVADSGDVKAIDLECRGFFRVDRIKDVIRIKRLLGIELPVEGWLDNLLYRFLTEFQASRRRYQERKRKLQTPESFQKYFRR